MNSVTLTLTLRQNKAITYYGSMLPNTVTVLLAYIVDQHLLLNFSAEF